jgi:hypothetical protein
MSLYLNLALSRTVPVYRPTAAPWLILKLLCMSLLYLPDRTVHLCMDLLHLLDLLHTCMDLLHLTDPMYICSWTYCTSMNLHDPLYTYTWTYCSHLSYFKIMHEPTAPPWPTVYLCKDLLHLIDLLHTSKWTYCTSLTYCIPLHGPVATCYNPQGLGTVLCSCEPSVL